MSGASLLGVERGRALPTWHAESSRVSNTPTSWLPISTGGRRHRDPSTLLSRPRPFTGLTRPRALAKCAAILRPGGSLAVVKTRWGVAQAMIRSSMQARRATPAGIRNMIRRSDSSGPRRFQNRAMTWYTQSSHVWSTDVTSALENTARPSIAICWPPSRMFWHSKSGAVVASWLAYQVSSTPSFREIVRHDLYDLCVAQRAG